MKETITFIFANLLFTCGAQINVLNTSLTNPESQMAYHAFENDLVLEGVSSDPTIVIVTSTDTLHLANNKYTYKPSRKVISERLTVLKGDQVLGTTIFSIENLEDPRVYLGSIRGPSVTMDQLKENPGLVVSYAPQLINLKLHVVDYHAVIIPKNGEEIKLGTLKHHGNDFSQSQLKLIEKMQAGDVISFKMVILSSPSGVKIKMSANVNLTLTE
ncbi:MAG: hypothetical protein ACI837_001522 [Crocinitomicaceae bacterium]|jgi:hypothetical protein